MPRQARETSTDYPQFLERLRSCVERAGSILQLANQSGIPYSTIRNYFEGTEPPRHYLNAIAKAANVDVAWLATGREPPASPSSKRQAEPGSRFTLLEWPVGLRDEYQKRLSQIFRENGGDEEITATTGFSPERVAQLREGASLTDYEIATVCQKLNVNADWLFFGRHEDQHAHGLMIDWPAGSKNDYKNRLSEMIDSNGGDRSVANITGFAEERITRLRHGARLTDYEAATLCQKLNLSLDWLLLGKQAAPHPSINGPSDIIGIDELSIYHRGGKLHYEIKPAQTFALSSSWVEKGFHCDLRDLAHFRMPNTEMEPIIREGASVVIHTKDQFTSNGIYVFRNGDQFLVRKLEFIGRNAEVISPQTQTRRYQIVNFKDNSDFHFFGKAIWWTTSSA